MAGGKTESDPITAWLGDEIRLDGGRLAFEGSLRVDGKIDDGTVIGATLVVAAGARVTGRIDVDHLLVYGSVDATARVRQSATVHQGGTFAGELLLERPVLKVEDGGTFRGRVTTIAPASAAGESRPEESRVTTRPVAPG